MNRFLLTALVTAACAFPCAAQTKEVVEEVDAKLADLRIAARHADERNEDVEILRRLLNKSLGLADSTRALLQPPTSWVDATTEAWREIPNGQGQEVKRLFEGVKPLEFKPSGQVFGGGQSVSQAVGPFDGIYLKGAGVVYTLRIPAGADLTFDPTTQRVGVNAGCTKCHQDAAVKFINHAAEINSNCTSCHTVGEVRPEAKAVSEWERAKMAVRGEKPTAAEPKKADKPRGVLCDPGTLTEQLIGQLYAHARHVRHLGEKESITLVVTFDALPWAKPTEAAGGPVGKPGFTPDELQALTLGDLHMKQGKHAEAVEAYLMGLVRFRESVALSFPPNIPYTDATAAIKEMTTSVRNTYKSLATAYLHLGQVDDAKAALEKATSLTVNLSTTKASDKPSPVGPAKLVVSVAKADLAAKDAAAFKKAVTVERVNFPAAEAKK